MAAGGRDISQAELEVLGALWRRERGTVRDVMQELETRGRRLAYTTILTLLGRLERKGYAARTKKEGPADVYRPRISRERVTANRLSALVEQLGEGEAAPLVLQLVQTHRLSPTDIRQLRELLTRLERQAEQESSDESTTD